MGYGERSIVEVGSHSVVNFGEGVNLTKGENMLFIQEYILAYRK